MGWLAGLAEWLAGLFRSSENKKVVAVRETTRKLCGFLPTVETVLALLAVNNPAVATASIIARKICAAVSAPRPVTLMGDAPIMVDGVEIKGEFVGKE